MAILTKEQQNKIIVAGIRIVGSILIAVAVAEARKRLAKR